MSVLDFTELAAVVAAKEKKRNGGVSKLKNHLERVGPRLQQLADVVLGLPLLQLPGREVRGLELWWCEGSRVMRMRIELVKGTKIA